MNRVMASLFVATALTIAMPAKAASSSIDGEWKAVVTQFEADLKAEGAIGASMAITKDGRLLKSAYYGMADQARNRKIDADTLFHWASITKMFTSVAAMQLRDRGKLSLDDRVIDYLPEFKKVHNPHGPMSAITIRHLITHSSGLRSSTFPWRGDNDWAPLEPAKWSQVAAMMPYSEIEFPPGGKFSYSNPGLSMLGRIVEEVSDDSIEGYITKNILMPLGMTRSYFNTTPYFLQIDRSNNYERDNSTLTTNGPEVETGATVANGGLNGPVSDLLKFAHFLLGINDNGNYGMVLSKSSIEEMHRPLFDAGDSTLNRQQMGMSSFIIDQPLDSGKSIRFIGHTGGQVGFSSFVYVQPDSKSAAVFVMNTRNNDVKREDGAFAHTRAAMFTRLFPKLRDSQK